MTRALLAFSALIFLAGCPPEDFIVSPPGPTPAPAPIRLRDGAYSVLVIGVTELDCEGMRGPDLVGTKLPLDLAFHGHDVDGDLAGFPLSGERRDGVVTLSGSETPVVVYGEDDEATADSTEVDGAPDQPDEGEDGSDSSGGSAGGSAGGGSSGGSAGGSAGGGSSGGSAGGGAVPPEGEEIRLSLELVPSSAVHAEGTLAYEMGACSFAVPVVADRIADGDDPVPVPETGGGEAEEPPCDDEADDCG